MKDKSEFKHFFDDRHQPDLPPLTEEDVEKLEEFHKRLEESGAIEEARLKLQEWVEDDIRNKQLSE
jgi:hypothetical protein